MCDPGRKAALPAVLLTGLFAVLLAVMLNQGGVLARQPVPTAVHVGLAAAYLITALLTTGAEIVRGVVVFVAMLATQAVMALFTGLAYAAAPGGALDAPAAFVYALTGYLPGLLLQSAVVFLMAPMAAAWWGGPEAEVRRKRMPRVPHIRDAESFQDFLDRACEWPEVAGVAICEGEQAWGAGIWRSDPAAACERARSVLARTGKASHLFILGDAALGVYTRKDRIVAVSLGDASHRHIAQLLGLNLCRAGDLAQLLGPGNTASDAPDD